jgi:hypothetical protein
MKRPDGTKIDRRRAIGALGALGAGAAAAAGGGLGNRAKADSETNDERRKARYKETDHVRAFYRVNRYPS